MSIIYVVVNQTDQDIRKYTSCYRRIVNKTKKLLNLKKDYALSVIFVNKEEIHQINAQYRNIDKETDVISFASMDDMEVFEEEFDEIELGDIFISVDAIIAQAKEYGHSELREASFLFTHGLLHLLGYDHMKSEEDEKEMFDLQDEILAGIVDRQEKKMTQEELLKEAWKAMDNAYAPYSNFHVGACVLCKDGRTFYGANIENASYGATNCAERSAIFSAYSNGVRKNDIEALAIVSDGKRIAAPCGICRQVLSELLNWDTPIVLGIKTETKVVTIPDLLPMAFGEDDLK